MEKIQKLIAHSGYTSRRNAEIFVKEGVVKINGKTAVIGDRATFDDIITIKNIRIKPEEKVYYLLNKPTKTISSLKDNFNRKKVTDFIQTKYRIFPVGRLDYNTTGVLLLTNDGELANKLIHPRYSIIRKYRARLDQALTKKELYELNKTQMVNNKPYEQIVEQVENKTYLVTLTAGSYHHIKLLFQNVNKLVISLKRVEFAGLNVNKIPLGEYRKLNFKEIKMLHHLTKDKN